jgi:ATP adenylyltransferase/5',5'''-P-1,P-4-tetraphosphate phosphorylase II
LWTYGCRQSSNPTKKMKSLLSPFCSFSPQRCPHSQKFRQSPNTMPLFHYLCNLYSTWRAPLVWQLVMCRANFSNELSEILW